MNHIKVVLIVGFLVNGLVCGADQKGPELSVENLKAKVESYFAERPLALAVGATGFGIGAVAMSMLMNARARRLEQREVMRILTKLHQDVCTLRGTVSRQEIQFGARFIGLERQLDDIWGAMPVYQLDKRVTKLEQRLAPVVVKPVKTDSGPAVGDSINFFELPKTGC